MKAVFDTTDYGRIEVNQEPGKPGMAYFGLDDIEAEVQPNGSFESTNQIPFQVHWPSKVGDFASLDVIVPKMIAFTRPT